MRRQRLSLLAHADHPIHAPLADASVAALLGRAVRHGDERLLDLGCGEARWLLHALRAHPGVRATGVDTDDEALARGRSAAEAAGVSDRLTLHAADAGEFASAHRFDVVLCVGASHAFGGLPPTLRAARAHLAPGGTVLVGDGFWERPPEPATLAALGATPEEFADLATTVDRIRAAGWVPVYGHVSTAAEWDAYEWSWVGSLARWALDHPEHPDGTQALRTADEHRRGWLHGYRGTLGFVTLLLRREGTTAEAD